jgi:hypothetical protein
VCSPASLEEMDIAKFRTAMFEFTCGARMAGIWPNWSWLNDADLNHVCSREDVTEYCLDWARKSEEFGDICAQLTSLANGDYKKEHKKWMTLSKKKASSENAPAVFSGAIDFAALQARSPSVRKNKAVVDEQGNLEAIVQQLQLVWDGSGENPWKDEKVQRERAAVILQ